MLKAKRDKQKASEEEAANLRLKLEEQKERLRK